MPSTVLKHEVVTELIFLIANPKEDNVYIILKKEFGKTINSIQSDMTSMRYSWRWQLET